MTEQREKELILKGEIKALRTFLECTGLSHTKTYKKAEQELIELTNQNK